MTPNVLVTGLGVVSPLGSEIEAFWRSCLSGTSGIRPIQAFDAADLACQIAGEAWDFDPRVSLSAKETSRMGRFVQMSVVAVDQAATQAKLSRSLGARVAVVWGNGSGGTPFVESIVGPARDLGWRSCEAV